MNMTKFIQIQGHLFSVEGLRCVYTTTQEDRKMFSKAGSTRFKFFIEYNDGKKYHWEFPSQGELIQNRDIVISEIRKLVEQV